MPINFHDPKNYYTYATRTADPSWLQGIEILVHPHNRRVIDIGCGGGIYARAWLELGAASVIGVDFSAEMVQAAVELSSSLKNINYIQADAKNTGLPDQSADIVFSRAVIHHLPDQSASFREAHRLLVPGGIFLIQDRTRDDVHLPGTINHLRGYFFECFPRLLPIEDARRPEIEPTTHQLLEAGFTDIAVHSLWEVRQKHAGFTTLAEDLRSRAGRSILHELDRAELENLIEFIAQKLPKDEPVIEQDRWTLWLARRE